MKHLLAAFAGSAAGPAQFPRDALPEVAFLGRSNVGKSSLLNAVAGVRNLARVSSEPGRTRLVNFYRVGDLLYLADLPGYGFARVPEAERRGWEGLVRSYLVGREPLALAVVIVDARHEPSEGDRTLREWLDDQGLPYVVAANKVDKVGQAGLARVRRELPAAFPRALDVLAVSALKRTGLDALWRRIRETAEDHRQARLAGR